MSNGLTKVYREDGSSLHVNERTMDHLKRLKLSKKNPKAKAKPKSEDKPIDEDKTESEGDQETE